MITQKMLCKLLTYYEKYGLVNCPNINANILLFDYYTNGTTCPNSQEMTKTHYAYYGSSCPNRKSQAVMTYGKKYQVSEDRAKCPMFYNGTIKYVSPGGGVLTEYKQACLQKKDSYTNNIPYYSTNDYECDGVNCKYYIHSYLCTLGGDCIENKCTQKVFKCNLSSNTKKICALNNCPEKADICKIDNIICRESKCLFYAM